MINEVSISNYKSIFRQRFSLSRLNVFVGRRGSGKTNILEALGIAAAAHDDALDADSLYKRGIAPVIPSLMVHWDRNKNRSNKEIEIVWHERNSWKKAKLVCENPESIDARWKDISWYEPSYIEKINNLIQFISDGSIDGKYPFADESKNAVLNAAFRGSRNFRNYKIYNVVNEDNNLEELEDSLFSNNNTPSIFAIDNLPSYIDSHMLATFSQLAVKHNKQAFIATDNPAIVKDMNINDPSQKIFVVKMTQTGQTLVEEQKNSTIVEI